MTDLSAALKVAIEAAAVARAILLKECALEGGHRGKIGKCPADDEAEWAIRERLLGAFPEWGFLGEETGELAGAGEGEYVWVVDPNDGTSSMQRGWRGHAVSIGVVSQGVPVLGVVHGVDAPDDEGDLVTWAEGCGPVCRNGVEVAPLRQGGGLRREDVVALSIGADRNPVGNLPAVAPARYVGVPSIAYRLALVAAGEYVATVSLNSVSAWDIAGGHALVRGAGGVLVDERGREVKYARNGHSVISEFVFAGSREVVAELVTRQWRGVTTSGFGAAAPPTGRAPLRPRPDQVVHDSGVLRRAQGCLLGQLAGDALGALVEFSPGAAIERQHPDGGPRLLADGGPHRILAGQPTDDSELALLLARSLVVEDGFDQEAVAAAYAGWYHGWTHSLEPEQCGHRWCRPFDVGGTTSQALGVIDAHDVSHRRAAQAAMSAASRSSQANGALMRVSPLGIWGTLRSADEVAEAARQDAQLTHPHPVCQDASAVFAVTLARSIREGLDAQQAYAFAVSWARDAGTDQAVLGAIESASDGPPESYELQQGWVLIALRNAFFRLLHAETLEEGVVDTVRAGGDTDTNAAICGALLGAVHGRDAVPFQWRQMVLSCRPMLDQDEVRQPRPAVYWPIDALILAERLVAMGGG